MLIVRALPPTPSAGNRLLKLYHEQLRRHWSRPDRILGMALSAFPQAAGWSEAERRLLQPEVRARGLSMAARKGIHALLNPGGLPIRDNVLRNKALFAHLVARYALAAPATFTAATDQIDPWLGRMPAIITKPSFSSKGRNVRAFTRAGSVWRTQGQEVSSDKLKQHCLSVVGSGGVVQEFVRPHASLDPVSPGVLPTLRLVTCLDELGDPEVCTRILRLGAGGEQPVDNFNAGGIAVGIDSENRCTVALRSGLRGAELLERHPVTAAAIAGLLVPDLTEACALAIRAHAALPAGYTVVGWDVGLSNRGPVLVEGNWNPGTQIVQLVEGIGLDQTRLGALYCHHLRRLPADRWRAASPIQW